MKNAQIFIKPIVLIFILVIQNQFTFGQDKRVCDISVNLLTPKNDFTLKSPGSDSCEVALTNLGPDSVLSQDLHSITLKFGGFRYLPFTQEYGQNLAPGDSVIVTFPFKLNGTNDADDVSFCIYSVTSYTPPTSKNKPLMLERDSANFLDNNTDCVTGYHRMYTSSVDEKTKTSLVIYPNPTTSKVRFKALAKNQKITCTVLDMMGKTVLDFSDLHNQEVIDVSMLSAGLYFVRLESIGVVQTGKFIKK